MEPKTENLRNWLLDLEPHPFLEKSTSFAGGSVLFFLIAHHVGFVSDAGGVAQKGLVKLVSSIKRGQICFRNRQAKSLEIDRL